LKFYKDLSIIFNKAIFVFVVKIAPL